eukprot:TRINITY_DN826_c0_g3_i1.p10 TRINITY_DN826_c0_g3~~TRINITY_DN826_c0_g3_i1.p10  ORF type:complete len:186 (+),score=11.30 TRINITY_DN826_c0_g3_i1:5527-6084(+)
MQQQANNNNIYLELKMDKGKGNKIGTIFDYLLISVYTLLWAIITFISFYNFPTDDDHFVRLIAYYTILMGGLKIITCAFSLLLLCGVRSLFVKELGQFLMLFARIIDGIPTAIYAYKGIWQRDPMAFLFLFPKTADTLAFWVVTAANGAVKPCYFCLSPEEEKEEENDEETIELRQYQTQQYLRH